MQKRAFLLAFFFSLSILASQALSQEMPPLQTHQQAYKERAKGNYERAIALFQKAASKATDASFKRYLLSQIPLTWKDWAFKIRNQGNFKGALDLLHQAEKYTREEMKDQKMTMYFRFEVAITWEVLGDLEKAKKAYFWAEHYREIGNLFLREGKVNEAIGVFRSIVRCSQEGKDVYVQDAAKMFLEGEAVKCPKDGAPTGLSCLDSIGMCHEQLGQLKEAESAYKAGLQSAPTPAEARIYESLLGYLYQRQNKNDMAFQAFRSGKDNLNVAKTLTKMKQDDAASQWYRSVIKEETDNIDRANKQYEQIKQFEKSNPIQQATGFSGLAALDSTLQQSYTKMGDALMGLNDMAGALKAYQKAKEYAVSLVNTSTNNGANKFELRRMERFGYKKPILELDGKIAAIRGQ